MPSCGHATPKFGCLDCIEAAKIPKTEGGRDELWKCPNCEMRHRYSRMVCEKADRRGGLIVGTKGCGYDRRTRKAPDDDEQADCG